MSEKACTKKKLAEELEVSRPTLNKILRIKKVNKVDRSNFNSLVKELKGKTKELTAEELIKDTKAKLEKPKIKTKLIKLTGDLIKDQVINSINDHQILLEGLKNKYIYEGDEYVKNIIFNQIQATEKLLITLRNQYRQLNEEKDKKITDPFGGL